MGERSGAPSGFSPASIVISKGLRLQFNYLQPDVAQLTVTHPTKGKTPFVAAVATTDDGKPDQIILRPVKAFSLVAIRKLAATALAPDAQVLTDGLACFAAVADVGCAHAAIKTGAGPRAAKTPAFKWVNTALGNIKAALVGTYRAVRSKHVPRYLAEFEYRFNRRYDLSVIIPRLAFVALRTAPMPYRLLKLADVAA